MPFDLLDPGSAPALARAQAEALSRNRLTQTHNLALSPAQARSLALTRAQALCDTGRVEFGGGVIGMMIESFYDSPFLTQGDYAETLGQLIEIFYEYKNETQDRLADDTLIEIMRNAFDGPCQGSAELLAGRSLYDLARLIRLGPEDERADDPKEEDDEPYRD